MSAFYLQGIAQTLSGLSAATRKTMLAKDIGRRVPLLDGLGIVCEELTQSRVVLRLPNKVRVHNAQRHVHPMAMALVAETAAGMALGMNQAAGQIFFLKGIRTDFYKSPLLIKGDLIATASMTDMDCSSLQSKQSGSIQLTVRVIEESREALPDVICSCHTEWSW